MELDGSHLHYIDIAGVPTDALRHLTSLYAFVVLWEGNQCLNVISEASANWKVPTIVAHESLASSERVRVRAAGADFITPFPLRDELIYAMKASYHRRLRLNRTLREQGIEHDPSSHVNSSNADRKRPQLTNGADQKLSHQSGNSSFFSSTDSALLPQVAHTHDEPDQQTVFRVGPLVLDSTIRRVSVRGTVVQLSTRPYDLLCYLIRNVGRCCSRGELLEEVWDMDFDPSTNVVDVQICELRRILSEHNTTDLIRTVRGSGYMMVAAA
jgi:two-component system OmpR family response regulator